MLKKMLLSTFTAATLIVPVTGAFAAEDVTIINQGSNPPVLIESPTNNGSMGSGGIGTMTTTFRVKTATNLRATPSSTGAFVASVYPGELLTSNFREVTVKGVVWVEVWNSSRSISGYLQLSTVEEYG